jgi:DivIVA domain-containing protein
MSSLPKVAKGKYGYSVTEVDQLLARARDQYANPAFKVLDWRELTATAFKLEKGGYQTSAVDSALDKLQDTFAEREAKLTNFATRDLKELLLGRTERPRGKRFSKVGVLGRGYSRAQVDALLDLFVEHVAGQDEISLDELRELKFKLQRGGYIESQVDAYVDRMVEFIQKERFLQPVIAVAPVAPAVIPSGDSPAGPGDQLY